MDKFVKNLLCFCSGVIISATASADATSSMAKVISSNGDCYAQSEGGKKHSLSRGVDLTQQETVVAGANCNMQLRFSDNGLVAVRPNSKYVVNNYKFQPTDSSANTQSSTVIVGQIRSMTGEIGHTSPKSYKLSAGNTTISTEGTNVQITAIAAPSANPTTAAPGTAASTASSLPSTPTSTQQSALAPTALVQTQKSNPNLTQPASTSVTPSVTKAPVSGVVVVAQITNSSTVKTPSETAELDAGEDAVISEGSPTINKVHGHVATPGVLPAEENGEENETDVTAAAEDEGSMQTLNETIDEHAFATENELANKEGLEVDEHGAE